MANEWEKVVKTLKEEIIKNRKEIKLAIEASESKLLLKIEELHHRVKNLEIENSFLTNKIEAQEIATKKNNIIIFGLDISEDFSPSTVCREFKKLLDVEVQVSDLNNTYRLRSQGRNSLKVEFISYLKKLEVLRHCKKLKGSGIVIANDLTYKQRCQNKILRNHLGQARLNPSNNCYIRGNRLYINNKAYTVEELEGNENSQTENNKSNSAPPTPTVRNLEKEFHFQRDQEDKSETEDSTIEETNRSNKDSRITNTPTKENHSKKTFKNTAVPHQKERTKNLRSGSTSSGRI